jgi:hypothetical protein
VSNGSTSLKNRKRSSASLIFYTATHNNHPPPKKKRKEKETIWKIADSTARERKLSSLCNLIGLELFIWLEL